MAVTLRHFVPIDPSVLLSPSSPWFGWIKLIIYCVLFITIVHAFFPKHLQNHPGRRSVAVVLGLMLGIGLFLAEKTFHFSFESFAFLSIWILIFIIGIVAFGVFRMGLRPDLAFATTYILIYLSFLAITPSLFDAIGEFFDLLNIALFACFIYLIGFVLLKIFKRKESIKNAEGFLAKEQMPPSDQPEIKNEIEDEKTEESRLKYKTMKLNDYETDRIEDIDRLLNDMIVYLKKHQQQLTDEDKQNITRILDNLRKKRNDFQQGFLIFKQHIEKYKSGNEKKLKELLERLKKTKDNKKKSEIRQEWIFEKKKLDIETFIQQNEPKLTEFLQSFEQRIFQAIESLKINNTNESILQLSSAKANLEPMKTIFRKFKTLEKYLLSLTKKEERVMEEEAKGK